MDYEKILESLKICSEVGTSCEGCSGRGERHCIANLTKAAAIAIETLLHALDMAKRERDVVTKRMIELEQETVTNRHQLNELLRGGDGAPEKADALHIVHCVDCKHKYFKDFSAFCPHRFGPLRPGGYCEHGESEGKDG